MRKKALDVFHETNTLFPKVSFEKAFPSIDHLTIEVEESGKDVSQQNNKSIYTMENPPEEYINCNNSRCFGGGFAIADILRDMVRNGQTTLETMKPCRGYEGTPEGKKRHRKCRNKFSVRVCITCKKGG